MKILIVLAIFFPTLIQGQSDAEVSKSTNGIQWSSGLSWSQIIEKATKENKYIFIDAFATWCKPCKEMDRVVFVNDSVVKYFNENFISVKVQLDKTKFDSEETKSWYEEARKIATKFRVLAFPTYLFLEPNGKRQTHVVIGYTDSDRLIAEARNAIRSGVIFIDKYAEFDSLLTQYQNGKKNYSRLNYMITSAKSLRKRELWEHLTKDYISYLKVIPKEQLFNREHIHFLATIPIRSETTFFKLFYENSSRVDELMGVDGYSDQVIDRVILRELVAPEINLNIEERMGVFGGRKNESEANWQLLYKKIFKLYPKKIAERVLLESKILWYQQHFNYESFFQVYLEKLRKYGFVEQSGLGSNNTASGVLFRIGLYSPRVNNQYLLKRIIKYGRLAITESFRKGRKSGSEAQDFAILLYRAGKGKEAVKWQKVAVKLANEMSRDNYQNNLFKFQKRIPWEWPIDEKWIVEWQKIYENITKPAIEQAIRYDKEPNWDSLTLHAQRLAIDPLYADRAILLAKALFFSKITSIAKLTNTIVEITNKFEYKGDPDKMEKYAKQILQMSNSKNELLSAIEWLKPFAEDSLSTHTSYKKTYDSLLAKLAGME